MAGLQAVLMASRKKSELNFEPLQEKVAFCVISPYHSGKEIFA
jgi:hypothetical protein